MRYVAPRVLRGPSHTEREIAGPAGDHTRRPEHLLLLMRLGTPGRRRSQSVVGAPVAGAQRAAVRPVLAVARDSRPSRARAGDLLRSPLRRDLFCTFRSSMEHFGFLFPLDRNRLYLLDGYMFITNVSSFAS